jgi:hypothetical protein
LHRIKELLAERLKAACRWREALAVLRCTVAGRTRVNSAATSMTEATGTSHQAMKAKIAKGAQTAIVTCGSYWPKKY